MDKHKRHGAGQHEKGEASFNLARLRRSINGGHRAVPTGLSTEELIEWISGPTAKDGSDR
ncbi:hypothetical protein FA101_29975 [Pseudomonas aeruginosa]|uniref:hypothetical protein n=1 Tax=Pseudomonas aeruginosa TaxID=287 RepID=UPI0034581F2F|nr:hypothetical protein [Pseudomonas aeruginosa]